MLKKGMQTYNQDSRKKSTDKSPIYQNDQLRSQFKDNLIKLLQLDTREQAMKNLKKLILQNKTTLNLRTWISVLSENRKKQSQSEILVIKFIIESYGKGLLDPLDKIPSLEKTIFRVTEIITKFFNEQFQNVTSACQKTWVQLYFSCLIDEKTQLKKKLLYDNLEAIINGGGGKVSQMTAQLVVEGLLQASLNKQDLEFFKQMAKRTLVLFLKTTVNHSASLGCLQTILSFFNINNLIPLLNSIVNKIFDYIANAQPNNNGYKIKSESCNCITMIGQQIDANGLLIYPKIVKVMEDMATHKVWAVQTTGRKALTTWRNRKQQWDQEYQAKQQKYNVQSNIQKNDDLPIESYRKQFQQNPIKKEFATENQFYAHNESQIQSYDHNKKNKPEVQTYNQGWIKPAIRYDINSDNSRYLHKNTGIGGGNSAQANEKYYDRQKPQQTYHQKMEQIKKSIYDKKNEEFSQYDETVPWDEGKKLIKKYKNEKKNQEVLGTRSKSLDSNFITEWERIVVLYDKGKHEQSVKLMLKMDDDIYFLRFMVKYGNNLLAGLTRSTSSKILKKMINIKKINFMQQMMLKLVAESAKSKVGQLMTNNQNMLILQELKKMEKIPKMSKISSKMQSIYEKSLID